MFTEEYIYIHPLHTFPLLSWFSLLSKKKFNPVGQSIFFTNPLCLILTYQLECMSRCVYLPLLDSKGVIYVLRWKCNNVLDGFPHFDTMEYWHHVYTTIIDIFLTKWSCWNMYLSMNEWSILILHLNIAFKI